MNLSKISGLSSDQKKTHKSGESPDSSSFEEYMKVEKTGEAELEKKRKNQHGKKAVGNKITGDEAKVKGEKPSGSFFQIDENLYDTSVLDFIEEPEEGVIFTRKKTAKTPLSATEEITLPKSWNLELNIHDKKQLKQFIEKLPPDKKQALFKLMESVDKRNAKSFYYFLQKLSPKNLDALLSQTIILPEDKSKSFVFALSEEELKQKGRFDETRKKPLSENRQVFIGIRERKDLFEKEEDEEEKVLPEEGIRERKSSFEKKKDEEEKVLPEEQKFQNALQHPEALPQAVAAEHRAAATESARITATAKSYLSPEIERIFSRMVSTIILMNKNGISQTEIILNSPSMQNTPFYGTRVIFQEYSSAQNSFNISFVSTPEAIKLFNANFPSLIEAFQKADVSFKINRLEAELETKDYFFKRKGEGQTKDSGAEGGKK